MKFSGVLKKEVIRRWDQLPQLSPEEEENFA